MGIGRLSKLILIVLTTIFIYGVSLSILIDAMISLELSLTHSWMVCAVFTLMFTVITIIMDKLFIIVEPDQEQIKRR